MPAGQSARNLADSKNPAAPIYGGWVRVPSGGSKRLSALPTGSKWLSALPTGSNRLSALPTLHDLFPLERGADRGGHVVDHAVNAGRLGEYALADALEQVVGQSVDGVAAPGLTGGAQSHRVAAGVPA